MENRTEIERIMAACIQNAEELLNAARVVPEGSNHIALHLTALALEEIGKSSMIFMSSLRGPGQGEDERKRPVDWIEDHERKLFWALWSPRFDKKNPWQDIQKAMNLAKHIHEVRLATLYVDPADPDARTGILHEELENLIGLTEARLGMEKAKKLRELTDEQKSDIDWFFVASEDPQLRMMIFSQGSFEKQAEFKENPDQWIRWLRTTIEESNRLSMEMTQKEMNRVPPDGEEGHEDKWEVKIRLRSWSHSIKQKPLNEWNEMIDKIKLFTTKDKSELLVKFIAPKKVQCQMVWAMGMQSSMLLVIALNVGTAGFFWWHLPVFISKFAESVFDLEQKTDVVIERAPQLRVSWGHLTLTTENLRQVTLVLTHMARIREPRQRAPYERYFRALALMAKNDIFFQFEPNILTEFHLVLKEAMAVYGDWDGNDGTLDNAIDAAFRPLGGGTDFVAMIKDLVQVAAITTRGENKTRPITLDDVAKMKVGCDTYLTLKAAQERQKEMALLKSAREVGSPGA
jgi:AbiV family abortive infection protein